MSTYTKQWIGGLFLLALLILITPWFMAWRMKSMDGVNPGLKSPPSILEGLNLSETQRAQIKKLQTDYQVEIEKICESHCEAKRRVADILKSPSIDESKLFETEREVARAYALAEESAIKHVLAVEKILTPEQKARYLQTYADQINASCALQFVH